MKTFDHKPNRLVEVRKMAGFPYRVHTQSNVVLVLTDNLWGVPLYAWYVVEIETFEPGDIQGTLMTTPFEIFGPFPDWSDGDKLIQDLCNPDTAIDAQG